MINTPVSHKRMINDQFPYICISPVCVWCSSIICCVYVLSVRCVWDFPELCCPAHAGTNPKLSPVLSFIRFCRVSFVSERLCPSLSSLTHLCQHVYFTSLPFTAFCSGSSYDCPPSQSLSRETRHAQSGCLYHVYLCCSRVSFLPSFQFFPSFIVCNISSGLTG